MAGPELVTAVPRGGRYCDVIVDPATLQVQVCGESRRWRRAADATASSAQAWLTLIEFAGIIVVTVALTSAVLKRAARK